METVFASIAKLIQDNGMAGFIAVGATCLIYYVLKQQEKREMRDAEREKTLVALLNGQKEALNNHTLQQREMFLDQKVSNGHNRDEHKEIITIAERILDQCTANPA